MSHFLCIAIPERFPACGRCFASPVTLNEVAHTPIGRATLGNKPRGMAYLATVYGDSTELLGKGHKERRCPEHFVNGVNCLLERLPSVSFLIHFAHGLVSEEKITLKNKEKIGLEYFNSTYPNLDILQEDVRYIVTAPAYF